MPSFCGRGLSSIFRGVVETLNERVVYLARAYVFSLDKNLVQTELVYTPVHARAAPWVVGMGVGAWAARVVGGRQALGRRQERALWACAALALLGLPLAMTAGVQASYTYTRWGSALFVALSKPLWALGVGAVVLLCAAGRAPRPQRAAVVEDRWRCSLASRTASTCCTPSCRASRPGAQEEPTSPPTSSLWVSSRPPITRNF